MGCSKTAPYAWGEGKEGTNTNPIKNTDLEQEAKSYIRKFEREVQWVFSRVQHHWHSLNDKGERVPFKYCRLRTRDEKNCQCKMGFPKHVPKCKGVIIKGKVRHRIVCPGIAGELELSCSGRRNALGTIAGARTDPWLSGTSAMLAKLIKANTNVQSPYRLPIIK